jgi:hypothetical protein
LFVIDVDGAEGEATLDKHEQKYGVLPATQEVITGRDGGRHVYYRLGKHKVGNSAGKLGAGLDVRGNGGHVLLPPSIHPSGRPYRLSVDGADHIGLAPDWLHALLDEEKCRQGKPLEHWHRVLTEQISNGTRNSTLTSVCGKLLQSGLHDLVLLLDVMRCVNLARCEEPLSEDEVHGIVASVARSHLKRLRGDA